MNTKLFIKTDDLCEILRRLANKLESGFQQEIHFENDYYWNIDTSVMNNLLLDPKPDIGSINDDIEFVRDVISDDYNDQYLDLLRIAAILRALYAEIDNGNIKASQ